jgi:hypothetical protein
MEDCKMKLPAAWFILPVLLMFGSGCIKMEHSLRLRRDGTAGYSLKYAISEQAIVRFRAMEKLNAQLAESRGEQPPKLEIDPLLRLFIDPDEAAIRKALKQYEHYGIEIKEFEMRTASSWRHVNFKLEINDLKKVAKLPFFIDNGFSLTKDKSGNYVFYREPYVNRPAEIAKVPSGDDMKQLIPLLSGFKTVVRISVPGNIVSTTAFNNTVNTASWTFDFDHDPSAVTVMQHQPFKVVFKAPEADLPQMDYRGSTIK